MEGYIRRIDSKDGGQLLRGRLPTVQGYGVDWLLSLAIDAGEGLEIEPAERVGSTETRGLDCLGIRVTRSNDVG
jgi:hypothetical protein